MKPFPNPLGESLVEFKKQKAFEKRLLRGRGGKARSLPRLFLKLPFSEGPEYKSVGHSLNDS